MAGATTEEPLRISILNDFSFCPRRAALRNLEGYDRENAAMTDGLNLHRRTDTPGIEERAGVRLVRALPVFSRGLGLVGKADIVEFHRQEDGTEVPYPIDYKRGPRRRWDNDEIQLCAQGLCLEEMMSRTVPVGAVYHAASRHRRDVFFDNQLRELTRQTISAARNLLRGRIPPVAELKPRCDGCSLREGCMPELTGLKGKVAAYSIGLFGVGESGK